MKSYVSTGNHRLGAVAAGIAVVLLVIAAGTMQAGAVVGILTAAGLSGAMISSYARASRPAVRRRPGPAPAVNTLRPARAISLRAATARA